MRATLALAGGRPERPPMIITIFGTTGELIKLAPVLKLLDERDRPVLLCTTGQQATQIAPMLDDFGLAQPDVWFARGRRGRDLETLSDIPAWGSSVAGSFAHRWAGLRRRARADGGRGIVLVHGDTMTTVAGAMMGRALGLPVAHIEGGLRSGDLRNPFPEEMNRRVTSRLASVHFAPGSWAAGNLRRAHTSGAIVDTGANTIADALRLVPDRAAAVPLPAEPFGLVSLHRFELLGDVPALTQIMELLVRASRRTPLLFVDHPVTVAALRSAGLDGCFDDRLVRIRRQRYFPFIALLKQSQFLVTDSGGSQEECAYLGHPCLIHRAATERQEGLEGPVVLSRMRLDVVERFLDDPLRFRSAPAAQDARPSQVIADWLEEHGYVARRVAAETASATPRQTPAP